MHTYQNREIHLSRYGTFPACFAFPGVRWSNVDVWSVKRRLVFVLLSDMMRRWFYYPMQRQKRCCSSLPLTICQPAENLMKAWEHIQQTKIHEKGQHVKQWGQCGVILRARDRYWQGYWLKSWIQPVIFCVFAILWAYAVSGTQFSGIPSKKPKYFLNFTSPVSR